MYLPSHFAESRPEVLHQLMRAHPLATLVTEAAGVPVADEIPCLLDAEAGVLRAHVARSNPLWREHPAGKPVLAIFRGPQAYVSPAWYASKAEHGRVVPTWNYVVVQATGTLRVIDDAAWLRAQIETLTAHNEAGRATPWAVGDAPDDFIAAQMKAIVGLEICITSLTGKWKTSQNRDAADRRGAIAGLQAENTDQARQIAALIPS